jgi:nitrate reductase cytochrome c-type subunit
MPYSVVSNHPDCEGYAVVKTDDNEVMGCHKTQAQAEDQLTAINISEYGENRSKAIEVIEEKTRYKTAMELLKALKKEI